MSDELNRMERFRNKPSNYPFIKKDNEKEQDVAKKKKFPVRFKKRSELQKTYDTVQRKNPVNVNGLTKQNNTEAMNVLTAPTQILLNSAITSIFSLKSDLRLKELLKKLLAELREELFGGERKPKENDPKKPDPLKIGFSNDKVGFPNKTSWKDVDWEWIKNNHPKFAENLKEFVLTTNLQSTKLLENGFSIQQIKPNSNVFEIRKSFDLIIDKAKDLLKDSFKEHSKNIKADLSDIKDVKNFVVNLNHETGGKLSPLEMLVNIILLKMAKDEDTSKELEGLSNFLNNEKENIDLKKCTKDFGKAIEKGIENGTLVVGKSMEVAGKTIEVSGKAVQATGKAMQVTGEALQAVPVVGNVIGGGLIAGGEGLEVAGKGMEKAGEGISNVGEEISKKSETQSKNPLKNADLKILGFNKIVGKVVEINQELDRTSEPEVDNILTR